MESAGGSSTLCATLLQVGRDRQTLKEPVTRWHRAAWSHLYCRDTIVIMVPHSADSVASFVASGIAGSSAAPRQLLLPFHRVHMLPLIKLIKRKNTDLLLSSLISCFAFFIPPLPSFFVIQCISLQSEHSLCAQRPVRTKTHSKSPQHAGS